MAREANVGRRIIARAKTIPGLVVRKLHGSPFSVEGDPDFYGCYQGRAFAIELKQEGKEPTRLQLARLREWARAGAITATVRSATGFFAALGIDTREVL